MERIYLITGINGFLGRTVADKLLKAGKKVAGLRLPGDQERLLNGVEYYVGDITKKLTLKNFFNASQGKDTVVIHCAGLVTIASKDKRIWNVNVDGTRNIVDMCEQYHVTQLIYVSSVHAIEERTKGRVIYEAEEFSASKVKGIYGKSKAEATAYVRKAMERGLPAAIIHPSGMIGPGDYSGNYMTELIRSYMKHGMLFGVSGGYDFVDVRDVADGIISCSEKGISGESFILSNEYITVMYLLDTLAGITGKRKSIVNIPLDWIKIFAPFCERISDCFKLPMLVTPYSIYTLGSNGQFGHEKADKVLGYTVRPIRETLTDTVDWLRKEKCN